ncbi:BTB/POZ domain and ankyrin repeat-containing protein NPR1-like [Musa acuminata AAA Group]|uniref:BTB/POZ domain and ankyrin repeat-containing protein NPR1-like n=1 Tax=Musa acuminata AAA Group TaxID=214697 RepID=UPI0031D321D1
MEASQPFSDSDASSSSLCHPVAVAAAVAGQTVAAAEVAALSRLSEQLGYLLRSPGLSFCSDARITVRSSGGEPPRVVPVHRCLLAARSPFFRDKFAGGAAALELGEMVNGFEVGCEALEAVLQYVYTGRLEELPRGVAECVDEGCCRHEACWPAVHFMLQVLHAASTFEINELVSLFQRQLLNILQKVATDDILMILLVANLNNKLCQRLLTKCIGMVVESDIDYVALNKKLPPDIVEQIKQSRSNFGLDGQENLEFPEKHVKSVYGALDSDDIELVKLLLEEGGTTLDNAKALHYAVAYCDSKITKELLSLGLADVNGRDHRHYTVLHIAAMRKEPEIIMSLLTMGARPFDHTPDGRTALQISKRLTRSTDYYRSTEQGEPSPRERLCIEMLEQAEMRDSFMEVTSVPVEMISDNLQERLLYLESRVWLAESLFPTEAKAAMNNANVDGTLRFKSSCLTNLISGNKRSAEDVVKASFKMTEKDFSRMEALTKTVQLGMHFFPRCSKVIDRFLGDDLSGLSIVEHINTEERKNRYNEILEEMNMAFTQDKNEKAFGGSAASCSAASSSKSARAARNKRMSLV